jgi:hypothetical protein
MAHLLLGHASNGRVLAVKVLCKIIILDERVVNGRERVDAATLLRRQLVRWRRRGAEAVQHAAGWHVVRGACVSPSLTTNASRAPAPDSQTHLGCDCLVVTSAIAGERCCCGIDLLIAVKALGSHAGGDGGGSRALGLRRTHLRGFGGAASSKIWR